MLGKIRRIHFVGIGGIGMSGIAEVLLNLGFSVSGSDLKATAVTDRLVRLGAQVFEGHDATNLRDAQVVVVSSAVSPENPEVRAAQRLQIPVIARAEMLAELMRLKFCVAVAGAHGKTTVTSMIALMLTQAGLDPTAVIGGRLDVFASSARLGKSELMVVEADESDRSFLCLLPSIAVVTNIDREHLDHYRDLEEICSAFVSFMNKVPFYGAVVACADAPWGERLRKLLPQVRRRVVTYGLDPGADVQGRSVRLEPRGSAFEVEVRTKRLGSFNVPVPGRHNVQNALAAVAVGLELDLNYGQIRDGLDRFHGADRRFQIKDEIQGIAIVDDYGHHPTEIRATLEAARLRGSKRVIAIFQPHRYTRTQFLMDDFASAFQAADRVYVLDIYPASEKPIPGVTSRRLVERMAEMGFDRARYAPSEQAVIQEVLEDLRPGDMILTVGAGSVWKIGEALARAIRGGPGSLKRGSSLMSSLAQESGTPERLTAFSARWLPGEPLSRHTSLGVGGPADIISLRDTRHLPGLVEHLRERGVSWRVLGGGSNLLVADEGLPDVLLQLARGDAIVFSGNRAEVPASANLGTVVLECAKRNLGGMEGLMGVPGTVGGALRMNAGAYGTEIGSVVRALTVFHGATGVIETVGTEKVRFEYRHTGFSPDDVILAVTLELPDRPYAEILDRIRQFNRKRRASQPIQEKSAGCIFKNPPGCSTGKMIDELGLKGTRVGGAVISERHANFIVNRSNATATDILKLMEFIRERVFKAYGLQLEEEVIVWKG